MMTIRGSYYACLETGILNTSWLNRNARLLSVYVAWYISIGVACEEVGRSLCQKTNASILSFTLLCPYFSYSSLFSILTYAAFEDRLDVTLDTFHNIEYSLDVCISICCRCRGRGRNEHALFLLLRRKAQCTSVQGRHTEISTPG